MGANSFLLEKTYYQKRLSVQESKQADTKISPLYKIAKTKKIYQMVCSLNPCSAEPRICPAFANSVDPDQLASEEANWSWYALFAIQYLNISVYQ